MPSENYLKYHRPLPPDDPNQEYMTVQQTAFVLNCGVTWLREFLREHPKLRSKQGRRIVTDRAARASIYRLRTGAQPAKKSAKKDSIAA